MKRRLVLVRRAFTLIELLVVIAIIAILAGLLLPVLFSFQSQGQGRRVHEQPQATGRRLAMWANDRDGKFPWAVDMDTGGSKDTPQWIDHFRACSNELSTLNILVCPMDKGKTPAENWLAAAGLNNASYFVGLTAEESQASHAAYRRLQHHWRRGRPQPILENISLLLVLHRSRLG